MAQSAERQHLLLKVVGSIPTRRFFLRCGPPPPRERARVQQGWGEHASIAQSPERQPPLLFFFSLDSERPTHTRVLRGIGDRDAWPQRVFQRPMHICTERVRAVTSIVSKDRQRPEWRERVQ